MSDRDDNPLVRWSRRKQAARNPVTVPPDGKSAVDEDAVDAAAAERSEMLPSLEELTADSDLAAFLREGVPEILKNSALRKMWSLDPAIRDHVGLAEYAWDFNNPDSIPGFGSIGTDISVPDFISDPSTAESANAGATASSVPTPEAATQTARAPSVEESASFEQPETETKEEESHGAPSAPRHGGALPRE